MHYDVRNEASELELEVMKNKRSNLGSVKAAYIVNQHRVKNLPMATEYVGVYCVEEGKKEWGRLLWPFPHFLARQ